MSKKLLKIVDVQDKIGFGKTQIYKWVNAQTFPEPIRVDGKQSLRWVESEVDAWIEAQVSQNRSAA